MTWYVPPLPRNDHASKVAYWHCLLDIPDEETSAPFLRAMAAQRLVELRELSEEEAQAFLAPAPARCIEAT